MFRVFTTITVYVCIFDLFLIVWKALRRCYLLDHFKLSPLVIIFLHFAFCVSNGILKFCLNSYRVNVRGVKRNNGLFIALIPLSIPSRKASLFDYSTPKRGIIFFVKLFRLPFFHNSTPPKGHHSIITTRKFPCFYFHYPSSVPEN